MSSAAYYDYISRLIRSTLKVPDSSSFQNQDIVIETIFGMPGNIVDDYEEKIIQ